MVTHSSYIALPSYRKFVYFCNIIFAFFLFFHHYMRWFQICFLFLKKFAVISLWIIYLCLIKDVDTLLVSPFLAGQFSQLYEYLDGGVIIFEGLCGEVRFAQQLSGWVIIALKERERNRKYKVNSVR